MKKSDDESRRINSVIVFFTDLVSFPKDYFFPLFDCEKQSLKPIVDNDFCAREELA